MKERKRLQIGEGKISGYLSIFLAILSLGVVICAYYPELFTSQEFREFYTPQKIKWALLLILIFSLIFALTSALLSKKTRYGFISVIIISLAIFIGTGLPDSNEAGAKTFTIGLDWLIIDLLISAIIFIPIELFFPKRKNQTKFHSEWRTDLIYFVISHLLIQVIGVLVQLPSTIIFKDIGLTGLQETIQSIHFIPQLFIALFVSDLFQYFIHYIFHKVPFLWRFHAVHHSIKHLDWLAGSRIHFVDIIVVRAFSFIPLYALGFSYNVFITYIVIVSLQAVLAHSNTNIKFGLLKYLFVTPQYHHWHHAEEKEAHDKNFAIHFPIIDMLFGTYYKMGNKWPEKTGLGKSEIPKGFVKQFLFPFYPNKKINN